MYIAVACAEMLANAGQARPAIVGVQHEERVEGDEHERERLIERERTHVAFDPADVHARSPRAALRTLEHGARAVETDDVMTFLRDRNGDATRAAP